MSLDRKDIRAKLHPDMHEALTALCAIEQITIGEFVEREIVRIVTERVKNAASIVKLAPRLLGNS